MSRGSLFMRCPVIHFFLLLGLAGCTHRFTQADEVAIRQVMHAQEERWNAGDIPGFMQGYSDTICFIGRRGRTCGREAVTANYISSYPDQEAMGRLAFGIIEVVPVGEAGAWLTGTWQLARRKDTLAGGYSLLWTRERVGWRIVRDHSY
jgi:ketosteroid isomerase-like protein